MDLNEIKNRLAKLNNKGGSNGTSNFKDNFWRPPRMIALTNFDESDPIMEFAVQLRKSGSDENKELAKKLFPKMRTFAPVIVRGEEDKGVRFYEFGKMVYQELLGVMADEGKETEVKIAPSKGKPNLDNKLDELFN